ncbi:MAG: lactonase family protein [Muribaculaceae bacterium]|nr:lactonase family protein [Muribaculaceae bacterium]
MKKLILIAASAVFMASCSPTTNLDNNLTMVVGTYTDTGSEGLYSFRFNQSTGQATLLDSCKLDNPSYLRFSRNGDKIYAISELDESSSCVTALNFNKDNGSFSILNSEATQGSPCYISTNGKIVVTANYGGGTLSVLPLADDGSLLPLDTLFTGGIGGPDSIRQNVPHIHCAEFSPDMRRLFVSDFSAERLLCFNVADDGSSITPMRDQNNSQITIPVRSDYGPRHIIFDQDGSHAYVLGELSGCITVFDVADGIMTEKQIIDADLYDGRASADIHLSPDGRFLYSSNRRQGDGIAIFSVNNESGELNYIAYQPTALHPRHFNITPNGQFLLAACRDSNVIEIYSRDIESGLLSPTGNTITLPKPVCVQFSL